MVSPVKGEGREKVCRARARQGRGRQGTRQRREKSSKTSCPGKPTPVPQYAMFSLLLL